MSTPKIPMHTLKNPNLPVLGKNLHRYGIISLCLIIIDLLLIFFGPVLLLIPFILALSTDGILDVATSMNAFAIVCILIWGGLLAAKFVYYILFIINLRTISKNSEDAILGTFYNREFFAFIFSIISFFLLITTILLFFGGPVSTPSENLIVNLILIYFGINFVKKIISIMATNAFNKWTSQLKIKFYQIPFSAKIDVGAGNMNTGRIIQIFIGIIGKLVFASGAMTAGKNLMHLYEVVNNRQNSDYQIPKTELPVFNPEFQTKACPFCGSPVPKGEIKFCANCGKQLSFSN